ncbi:MAG TPA: hypothetical protein VGL11_20345 [Candidatus Binatia bacterium]|jgi:hypothetical protein
MANKVNYLVELSEKPKIDPSRPEEADRAIQSKGFWEVREEWQISTVTVSL